MERCELKDKTNEDIARDIEELSAKRKEISNDIAMLKRVLYDREYYLLVKSDRKKMSDEKQEHIRQWRKEYYKKNRKKLLDYDKKYRAEHKEKLQEYGKERYQARKEKEVKELMDIWK